MAEIRIKLEDDPTKAEEIAMLEKLRDFFKDRIKMTYLEHLFTDKFVGWCANQIRNDFTCDIYDWYLGRGNEITDLKKKVDRRDLALNLLDKAIKAKEECLINLEEKLRLAEATADTWMEKTSNYAEEIADLRANCEEYEKEITNLKVKLYDLLHKE